jgi:antigen flippase
LTRSVPWRLAAGLLSGERPLSALLQSVGTQVVITIINVVTGIITARLLGAEGRGIYTAVTLWPPLLATVALSGLNSAVVFRMRKAPATAGSTASAALLLGIARSLLAMTAGVLLLPAFMSRYDHGTILVAQICLVGVFCNCVQLMIRQALAGVGRFWHYNYALLLPQVLYLAALLVIIPFTEMTARNASLALIAAGAVAPLLSLPAFIRLVKPRLAGCFAEIRHLTSYSARAAANDGVFALSSYADRLVLIPFLPASELGFYAVAYSFSRLIQVVQPAILSVFFSHLSARTEAESRQLHDRACRFLLAILAVGCALLFAAGQWLLAFAYGGEFAAATLLFRVLVAEASLGVLSQVTIQLFLARDRPGVVSTVQTIVLCVSIAALIYLVPRYGAAGAAWGLLGIGVCRWVLLLAALKPTLGISPPRLYLGRDDIHYLLGRLRA